MEPTPPRRDITQPVARMPVRRSGWIFTVAAPVVLGVLVALFSSYILRKLGF